MDLRPAADTDAEAVTAILREVDDARILHWLGPMKPWKGPYVQGRPQWRAAEARTARRIRQRLA